MDITIPDKEKVILKRGKQEKCCQCIPIKMGMILIMIIQTMDVFNLILFSLAVLPIASFKTQEKFMDDFEFLNVYRGAKNNNNIFTGNASPDFEGGKTLVNGKSGGPPKAPDAAPLKP